MTIKDIAKESGYSVSTVSRVLNNRHDVSPEAKEKINEIVSSYNFVPNNNAKHLKQIASKTIIVLVKGHSNMLFSGIVEEIQKTISKTKYSVNVTYLDEEENEVEQAVIQCRESKPLGILFLGGNPEFFQDSFQQINVPSVLATTSAKELGFLNLSSVVTDDVDAAQCMMDYLLDEGHTKIGILGGSLQSSYISKQRFAGCMKSMEHHNRIFDSENYYCQARFDFGSAYRATMKLLDKAADITAVFTMSDVMAIGVIRAILDCGLKVPDDISVVGFDGIVIADYYNPKLTTIRQQYRSIAQQSVELLFRAMELKSDAAHVTVPFELALGESVRTIKKIN